MAPASVYIGGLPEVITKTELRDHLSIYGTVNALNMQKGYSFVEFDSEADALDLVRTFSNQPFMGQMCKIELARKPRRHSTCSDQTSPSPEQRRTQLRSAPRPEEGRVRYPVVVENLNPRTCWQELKDFGRLTGGTVAFCDIDRFNRNRGFLEYFTQEDADRVVSELNGQELLDNVVTLTGCGRKVLRDEFRSRSRSPDALTIRNRSRSPLPSHNALVLASRSPERVRTRSIDEREHQHRRRERGYSPHQPKERHVHFSDEWVPREWKAHSPSRNFMENDELLYASDERRDKMERIASEWLAYERHGL